MTTTGQHTGKVKWDSARENAGAEYVVAGLNIEFIKFPVLFATLKE